MEKLFYADELQFVNGTTPAINSSNLNAIVNGLDAVDTRVAQTATLAEDALQTSIINATNAVAAANNASQDAESAAASAEKAMSGTPEGYAQLVDDVKKKITTQYVANVNVDTLKAGLYWVNGYTENGGSVPYTNTHYTITGIAPDGSDGQCTDQIAVHHNGQSAKVRHRDSTSIAWGEWQTIGKETRKMLSDEWQSSVTYGINALVIHNNTLYRCKAQNSGIEPSNSGYWEQTSIASEIKHEVYDNSSFRIVKSGNVCMLMMKNTATLRADGKTLMDSIPYEYRPRMSLTYPIKLFNGNQYIEGKLAIDVSGVVLVYDNWGSAISGLQITYAGNTAFTYII